MKAHINEYTRPPLIFRAKRLSSPEIQLRVIEYKYKSDTRLPRLVDPTVIQ